MLRCCALLLLPFSVMANEPAVVEAPAEVPVQAEVSPLQPVSPPAPARRWSSDPEAYSIVSGGRGLSLHKPMYLMPLSYSPEFSGDKTEILFQISLKQQLLGMPLYVAYSQKSFFQFLNEDNSKPFRESNYNPEVFYRLTSEKPEDWRHFGMDIGLEHESNGQSLPLSRSWNRVYVAPFRAKGPQLIYWKWWYRLPESEKDSPNDTSGDDNPDIDRYMGISELHLQRQLFKQHVLDAMLRFNPGSGRGAIEMNYSWPSEDSGFFYGLHFFHGYGESLMDYNNSVTRLAFGVMLAR